MRRLLNLIVFVALSFLLTLVPQGIWSALLMANLKTGIRAPWAVGVMAVIVGVAWLYLGGKWGPQRTSQARRGYLRANLLPPRVFGWALAANGFAITALCGLWIVLFQLMKAPGNRLPDFSKYSILDVGLMLGTAAVVGAISEEAGIRGYLQGALERFMPGPGAVILAAIVISPGHGLTQGFVWPTLLFYFLVDTAYGTTAWLTNSILPGIAAHAAGLLVFFALIWPNDAARTHIAAVGAADAWFWLHVAQAAVFGVLAVWSFARLANAAGPRPNQRA